jgi:outer membrane protein OmpA-like peptidoglycan-associated protein
MIDNEFVQKLARNSMLSVAQFSRNNFAISAIFIIAAFAVSTRATAQIAMPSVDGVVQALTTQPDTRAFTPGWSGVSINGAPSQDLLVAFDGNTHRITVPGMKVLRVLGVALNDARLARTRLQVAGHVYLSGDPMIGQMLSQQRAQAVADHLSTFYEVAPDRLVPMGYGATRPLDKSNLASPLNQRIEIINLSPKG